MVQLLSIVLKARGNYEPNWHGMNNPTVLLHAVFSHVAECNVHLGSRGLLHSVQSWIINVSDIIWRMLPEATDSRADFP